jgi:molecular chaperone GrpE
MDDPKGPPAKVKVMDRRRIASDEEAPGRVRPVEAEPTGAPGDGASGADEIQAEMQSETRELEQDLLEDLRRLQAEFDNYRKRMLREQTAMASRASGRLIERLLPVLDNFERATEHGEGGPGIALVHKELRGVLEQEGLTEIEAEGAPFDPHLHEAVQAVDDAEATEPVCRSVFRRGYRLGDHVLRPAMVVVARAPERGADDTGGQDGHEGAEERDAAAPVADDEREV